MSITKLEPQQLTPGQALGIVAGASALGCLIAYLAGKRSPKEEEDQDNQKINIRDRSGGKKVGKFVTMSTRRQSKFIEEDVDEEEGKQSVQELLSIELKRHKIQQKKITQQLLQLALPVVDRCPHLVDLYGLEERFMVSPLIGDNFKRSIFGGAGFLPRDSFMNDDAFVIALKDHSTMKEVVHSLKFLKGGPREYVFFDPKKVRAAIVTCGGLCPGLNVVIREIVMSLHFNYEAQEIWGVKWGYKGFYTNPQDSWLHLTPSVVKNVHKLGGTLLGSSRGGFNHDKILDSIEARGINQVYIIGGDGTHRGINELIKRSQERKMVVSFTGIPKTIDNDIPIIDQSFGFNTSCEVAARMIEAAYVEATNAQFGVGLVKLMGRYSGFISRNAALANGNVDICLVPELPFELGGAKGLYETVIARVKEQGHCVVVVAEGAEEGLINPEEHITQVEKRDDSNNLIYDDIGKFLKEAIVGYAKEKHGIALTLKYIDPTYAIRSVPANSVDTIMCAKLAQNAVHGAMAGYTGFSVGVVRNSVAFIPVTTLIKAGVNRISMFDRMWQRLMSQNRQVAMVNDEFKDKADELLLKKHYDRKELFKKIVEDIKIDQHGFLGYHGEGLIGKAVQPEIDNA